MTEPSPTARTQPDAVMDALAAVPDTHLPNVFLLGAMKSGTSWLAKQIEHHPRAVVPAIKEPNLMISPMGDGFALKGPVDPDVLFRKMHKYSTGTVASYADTYKVAAQTHLRLDASIRYLVSDLAADRLMHFHSARGIKPRLLVILRDPVSRCWSHWQMHRAMGIEPLGFGAALRAEEQRLADGMIDDFGYQLYSRYNEHLSRYIRRFGRDAIHVEIQEEAIADPRDAITRVYDFLDLDPAEVTQGSPDKAERVKKATGSTGIEQVAQYYRPGWRKLLPKPVRRAGWALLETVNARSAPREIPAREAARLRESFKSTVLETEDILGRSLPWSKGHD